MIYCPDKNLEQAKVLLDDKLYWCVGHILHVECFKPKENQESEKSEQRNTKTLEITTETPKSEKSTKSSNFETIEENFLVETGLKDQEISSAEKNLTHFNSSKNHKDDTKDLCFDNQIPCNSTVAYVGKDLFCKSGTFFSSSKIFCSSVDKRNSDLILNCHFGYLPPHHTSFIPTTEDPAQENYSIEPEKSYIYSAVSFFVDLISKPTKKEEIPVKIYTYENATDWLPMAFPVDVGY